MGKQMMVVVSVMSVVLFLAADLATSVRPAAVGARNDISCEEGLNILMPCMQFFQGMGPTPSAACCMGAGNVFQRANTTAIRRNLCECFKKAAVQMRVLPERAKVIPELCHISLSFPLDPNIDCSTISV